MCHKWYWNLYIEKKNALNDIFSPLKGSYRENYYVLQLSSPSEIHKNDRVYPLLVTEINLDWLECHYLSIIKPQRWFNSTALEVKVCLSYHIPLFCINVIIYPCSIWRKAITSPNAELLSITYLGKKWHLFRIEMQSFPSRKCIWKFNVVRKISAILLTPLCI